MKEMIITGNVGRDPEIRMSPQGEEFATFSVGIAVGKNKTDWVDVSVNGKQVDTVKNYVKKGSKILVAGFPNSRAYMSRDNTPISVIQIYARNIELLSRKAENEEAVYNLPAIDEAASVGALTSDDIPF
jgi:single-strand DNA-binding protein